MKCVGRCDSIMQFNFNLTIYNLTIVLLNTMQAYNSDDKQKGLFTFYREQAEEEDKIKKRKKEHIAKMRQLQMETDGLKIEQIAHKNITKGAQKYQKQQLQQKKQVEKIIEQKQEQILNDPSNLNHVKQPPKIETQKKQNKQFQRRLLQILQKHKYDRNQRRNFKVPMRFGDREDIALKYHLQALMQQQTQMNKLDNKNDRNDLFTPKKQVYSAFEKVALCPTNFEVVLDQSIQHNKRNIINKKIVSALGPYHKKSDRLSEELRPKQDKQSNLPQVLQRNLLPKLNVKNNSLVNSNSVCNNREEFYSARDRTSRQLIESVPFYNVSKIKTNRDRSLCVESTRYQNESKIKQNIDNKIFPVFLDNGQSKKCEEEIKVDREKMYVQILQKLKFK